MDIRMTIMKLDENLKNEAIRKSDPISKKDALDFLYRYADAEKEANPKLSTEQAFAKAMTACPRLGGLAI